MTTSWHCFWRSKKGKVFILRERGTENHPPGKAPQDTPKASLLDPSWGAQVAPWGTKKGPKKLPGTGGKFAKKVVPNRSPEGAPGPLPGPGWPGPARAGPGALERDLERDEAGPGAGQAGVPGLGLGLAGRPRPAGAGQAGQALLAWAWAWPAGPGPHDRI